jgi:hypothetical protein
MIFHSGSSYLSRRRYSGGGSYSSSISEESEETVKILVIVLGSIFGVAAIVIFYRHCCRSEETNVVTVNRNPVAQAPDPQVQQGDNDPPTWSNKQDVTAYPEEYSNGRMPPSSPPVYSTAIEPSFRSASEIASTNGQSSSPYSAAAISNPPPNVTESTPTDTAGNIELGEPASNPYSNAGITWQSPDVTPSAADPPPSYRDLYNS